MSDDRAGETTITTERYEKYLKAEINLDKLITACDIEGHYAGRGDSACFICQTLKEIEDDSNA